MARPLEGLTVVDFTRVLAGPHCAQLLQDLGAAVVKIEPPAPDFTRVALPARDGMSPYYAQQNAGKKTVCLDLAHPEAGQIARDLCDQADVVVENFRAGALRRFGLDYESVAQRNPRVVYGSITGFGQDGPWSHRPAYAATIHAEAGLTAHSRVHYGEALSGWRTDSSCHGDVYTGVHAVVGILAALHARDTTGVGQHVDVSMAATMASVSEWAHAELREPVDLQDEPLALGAQDIPFMETADGKLLALAGSLVYSLTFDFYLQAMARPDLIEDPRFATASARAAHRTELETILQDWILTFPDADRVEAHLEKHGIAVGVVRSMKEFSETAWASHWGAFFDVPDRFGGTYRIPGRPWRFSSGELEPPGVPAFQGEHNLEILRSLGRTDEDIRHLVDVGAVVMAPSMSATPTHAPG